MPAIEQIRIEANGQLDPERKVKLGQFMTPGPVADFMASLFSGAACPVRLLDAGAGIGSLSLAFLKRWASASITAYEIDATMLSYLRETFAPYDATIIDKDFIQEAVFRPRWGAVKPETSPMRS
jgi:adenine-specific DNA-methyltransferase